MKYFFIMRLQYNSKTTANFVNSVVTTDNTKPDCVLQKKFRNALDVQCCLEPQLLH